MNPAPPPGAVGETRAADKTRPPFPAISFWVYALTPPLLAFFFYLSMLGNGFLNWDDPDYITDNPHIRYLNGASLGWMLSTFNIGNWIPLTWLSLAFDYALAGPSPWFFHLHSLLLHCANTVLVFFFTRKLLSLPSVPRLPVDPAACLTALLFGLHPLHVESVAWACELRDLLCGFFFLLALLWYLEAVQKPGWRRWPLWACLGSFLLALMSKPMAVTLPLVFMVLDAWPLGRSWKDRSALVREKFPFFVLASLGGLLAVLAQGSAHSLDVNASLPMDFRLLHAFHSVVFYLVKMLLPWGLHPFYPFDPVRVTLSIPNLISAALVAALSWACFRLRREKPWLAAAWGYFLLTLLPVLGLLQTGSQAAGDRFTYLPSLGPFLLASASAAFYLARRPRALLGAAAGLVLLLGPLSAGQLALWKNPVSFWRDVVDTYPDSSWIPHLMMGQALEDAGKPAEGLKECDKALALMPGNPDILLGRGALLVDMGRVEEGLWDLSQAVSLDPANPQAHYNLSRALAKKGLLAEEEKELVLAQNLNPEYAEACWRLGLLYRQKMELAKSAAAFRAALASDPANPKYLYNLALTCQIGGHLDDAMIAFQRTLQLEPRNPACYADLGMVYLAKGWKDRALGALRSASALAAPDPDFYEKLGRAFALAGSQQESAACLERAKALGAKSKKS